MFAGKFKKKGLMWAGAALLVHFVSYYLPKLLVSPDRFILTTTAADEMIPLVPFFILIYVGAYFQWGWYYLRQAAGGDPGRLRYLKAESVGKLICCAIYIIYPITIARPEVTTGGISGWLLRLIYSADTPFCLFPSIHCLQSWICFRYATEFESGGYAVFSGIFSVLVFASTVLVKQHLLADVAAGIVLAELCLRAAAIRRNRDGKMQKNGGRCENSVQGGKS